jgi:uncharacterized protein (TIGR02453 family)
MKSTFGGFPKQMPAFFRGLRKHNNRDWFEAHRDTYEQCVKAPMEELTVQVMAAVTRFAPEYAGQPRKAIYRIHRDTRFSNDKTPYKTHTGALLRRADLAKNESSSFYFAVSDRCLEIAGGCYMPGPDQLRMIRSHIAENGPRFLKLIHNRALRSALGELQGERLSRPPKGYCAEMPGIEPVLDYIKAKQWYHYVELDAAIALGPDVVEAIVSRFRKVLPVVEFLNEPLLASAKKSAPLTTGWF